MKLTKKHLIQIIKEELENAMSEAERPKTTPESRSANQALMQISDSVNKHKRNLVALKQELKELQNSSEYKESTNTYNNDPSSTESYLGMISVMGPENELLAAIEATETRLGAAEEFYRKAIAKVKELTNKLTAGN